MTDVARPTDVSGMTEADDTVHKVYVPGSSIAAKSKEALIEESNAAKGFAPDDPTAHRSDVLQDSDVPGFYTNPKPGQGRRITGEVDPIFGKSGYTIGDKIYHKRHKMEGKVIDLLASGLVKVKFENGKKGEVKPENIVKL
jgi:hypothetical protein